jgi:hypothetical protein
MPQEPVPARACHPLSFPPSFFLPFYFIQHPTISVTHFPSINSIQQPPKMLASSRLPGVVARMGMKQPARLMSTAQGQGTLSTEWADRQLHCPQMRYLPVPSQL